MQTGTTIKSDGDRTTTMTITFDIDITPVRVSIMREIADKLMKSRDEVRAEIGTRLAEAVCDAERHLSSKMTLEEKFAAGLCGICGKAVEPKRIKNGDGSCQHCEDNCADEPQGSEA